MNDNPGASSDDNVFGQLKPVPGVASASGLPTSAGGCVLALEPIGQGDGRISRCRVSVSVTLA